MDSLLRKVEKWDQLHIGYNVIALYGQILLRELLALFSVFVLYLRSSLISPNHWATSGQLIVSHQNNSHPASLPCGSLIIRLCEKLEEIQKLLK